MFDSHMDNIYQRANSILTTVVLTVHRTLQVVYWSQQQISFLGLNFSNQFCIFFLLYLITTIVIIITI